MKVTSIITTKLATKSLKTGFGAIICRLLSIRLIKCHTASKTKEPPDIGSEGLSFCVWQSRFRSGFTYGEILFLTLSILRSGANGLHSSPSRLAHLSVTRKSSNLNTRPTRTTTSSKESTDAVDPGNFSHSSTNLP